ncbi:DUF2871 domain-containing protein [Holdemanella sp.]|uniref:DUF2871 domain-containing protein n=1 Tax=Holdemanella sp. TaxID=1971762 RepID=UPI00308021EC
MKRYINYSIVYAVLAMIGGVFYREFTKVNDYTAFTTLSLVHTHYFILGMMFFLILGLISLNINFKSNRAVLFYNIGLNLMAIMLVVRGIVQVLGLNVVSDFISGVAGIGHTILGVSLILILLDIKKTCIKKVFRLIFNPFFLTLSHNFNIPLI